MIKIPQFDWQELPNLPETKMLTSENLIFQLETGEVYAGHYHHNGYFYNGMKRKSDDLFYAKGTKKVDTGFAHTPPKEQVIRWAYLKKSAEL